MDISTWKSGGLEVLRLVFDDGTMPVQIIIALVAAFVVGVSVMAFAGKSLGMSQMTWNRSLIMNEVAAVILVLVAIASWLYVVPKLPAALEPRWWLVVCVGVGTLLLVAPLQTKMAPGNYLQVLVNILFGLAAAVLVLYAVNTALDGVQKKKGEFRRIEDRTEGINQTIGK
jgi:hypothetical protein